MKRLSLTLLILFSANTLAQIPEWDQRILYSHGYNSQLHALLRISPQEYNERLRACYEGQAYSVKIKALINALKNLLQMVDDWENQFHREQLNEHQRFSSIYLQRFEYLRERGTRGAVMEAYVRQLSQVSLDVTYARNTYEQMDNGSQTMAIEPRHIQSIQEIILNLKTHLRFVRDEGTAEIYLNSVRDYLGAGSRSARRLADRIANLDSVTSWLNQLEASLTSNPRPRVSLIKNDILDLSNFTRGREHVLSLEVAQRLRTNQNVIDATIDNSSDLDQRFLAIIAEMQNPNRTNINGQVSPFCQNCSYDFPASIVPLENGEVLENSELNPTLTHREFPGITFYNRPIRNHGEWSDNILRIKLLLGTELATCVGIEGNFQASLPEQSLEGVGQLQENPMAEPIEVVDSQTRNGPEELEASPTHQEGAAGLGDM